jgi:carboxylesterase
VDAPLLPGHGTSPEDCNRHSWQEWLACAEEAYQRLKADCREVVIGGESTGALIGLYLAHNHPEVAAILCYAPALRLRIMRGKQFLLSLLVPFITSIPKPESTDNNPWKGYAVQPLKGAKELLRLQKVIPPLLPHIHQPILILQGRLDPTVHPTSAQQIFDRVGSSTKRIYWLEHSTHCVILDKERDLAANLTIDFLDYVLKI